MAIACLTPSQLRGFGFVQPAALQLTRGGARISSTPISQHPAPRLKPPPARVYGGPYLPASGRRGAGIVRDPRIPTRISPAPPAARGPTRSYDPTRASLSVAAPAAQPSGREPMPTLQSTPGSGASPFVSEPAIPAPGTSTIAPGTLDPLPATPTPGAAPPGAFTTLSAATTETLPGGQQPAVYANGGGFIPALIRVGGGGGGETTPAEEPPKGRPWWHWALLAGGLGLLTGIIKLPFVSGRGGGA